MILPPANYRDVQQELIAEIHKIFIWLVVVTVDVNIRITKNSDFVGRYGCYIILILDGLSRVLKLKLKC